MTFIQRLDGTTYDLLDYGIRTRDVLISSLTPDHQFSTLEGRNGVIDHGTTYGPRSITCLYRATSHDIVDFSLLRDEIFNIFRTEESFYLIEKRLPGKRWLVKVANPFQIPQRNIFGNFDVDFIGITGFAESIGTTADIAKNGLRYSDELWSYGMGLSYDEETHKYTHNTNTFRIYNAGNVEVHPFEQDLKITIANAAKGYKLTNTTTGDVFEYTGTASGRIVLDGPNVTVNSLQALRDTNRKFLTLAPGWNTFTQNQAREVKFDTRFYYK